MPATLHDILAAICTDVTLLKDNAAQISYSLNTAKEAQLAYDVLAAYGLDVRVYHENGLSKLYINKTSELPEEKLASALSYARTLRQIFDALQSAGSSEHQISFTNMVDMGKQVTILFPSQVRPQTHAPSPPRSSSSVQKPSTQAQVNPAADKSAGWSTVRKRSALMAAGPAVARKTVFVSRGFRGWMQNYFASYFAESFLAFCAMILLSIFVISVIVTAKGYMCPDLAVVKSRAWYCQ